MRILVGMMSAYAYAYEYAKNEGTLTITLMSTAKNGEYSEYASAYNYAITGANIRATNEKLAFLQTKFPEGSNLNIDEYLYGDATSAQWTAFSNYLHSEFGPTKQQ